MSMIFFTAKNKPFVVLKFLVHLDTINMSIADNLIDTYLTITKISVNSKDILFQPTTFIHVSEKIFKVHIPRKI